MSVCFLLWRILCKSCVCLHPPSSPPPERVFFIPPGCFVELGKTRIGKFVDLKNSSKRKIRRNAKEKCGEKENDSNSKFVEKEKNKLANFQVFDWTVSWKMFCLYWLKERFYSYINKLFYLSTGIYIFQASIQGT